MKQILAVGEDKNMQKSKVVLLPCSSYREDLVYESLKKGLELLGGLASLVGKEEKILLKRCV